jgi:regulator of sirC expression with transglutaminase-like and TPR domain
VTDSHELDSTRARLRLEEALGEPEDRLDLVALAVASLEYPALDHAGALAQLDGFAERVRALKPVSPDEQLGALRQVLAQEEGFRGQAERYFHADSSHLNRVLETRVGLPITLSVVYVEVARRARIPLFGISFPGHFLAGLEDGDDVRVIDPYNAGRELTRPMCEGLLVRMAPNLDFSPALLEPASMRDVGYRMLQNLKRLHLERGEGERALKVLDLLLVLAPDHPGELRTRAGLLSAMGAYKAALSYVERCLHSCPGAPDAESLREAARALREKMEQLN